MKKVKIGLIGGGMIHNAHMQGYLKRNDVEVIAVCALPEQVNAFAQLYSIPKIYTDIDKIVRDPDIDIIDIGLPVHLHEEAVIKAAEEGKGVLCEKPLGLNANQAKKMLDTVEKNKVFNAYLENYTFFNKVEEMKKFIESGVIGEISYINSSGGNMGPDSEWFYNKDLSGGGALIDLGVHSIEVVRWLLDKKNPNKVFAHNYAMVNEKAVKAGVEDTNISILQFGKASFLSTVGWGVKSGGEGMKFEINGTEGTISSVLPSGFPIMRVFSTATEDKLKYAKTASMAKYDGGWYLPPMTIVDIFSMFIMEMDNIISAYKIDSEPRHIFHDGWVNNVIIDALYQSASEGRWIDLKI